MGLPMKHILKGLKIGAAIAGVEVTDGGETRKIELKENELLEELLQQQKITNAVLVKLLEKQDPDAAEEIMKALG